MNREEFDQILIELKQAENAREQADILDKELQIKSVYADILLNTVAVNLSKEEFGENGVYDGRPPTE